MHHRPETEFLPAVRRALLSNLESQLTFGQRAANPGPTSGWLDPDGTPDPDKPQFTWLSARTLHVYSAAAGVGFPRAGDLATIVLRRIRTQLEDKENGGWFASISPRSGLRDTTKFCYVQAHVCIAAAAAVHAGVDGGTDLLKTSLQVLEDHFWEERPGTFNEAWDQRWVSADTTHSATANMHCVEAMLGAATVLPDASAKDEVLLRARRVVSRFIDDFAATNDWRMPQHFDAEWRPLLDYGASNPADPFAPFGATVGLGFEWSRLAVELHHALTGPADRRLLKSARELYTRAAADGWIDGERPGFVYTTDWSGKPIIRKRLHWVHAEAVSAAATLWSATREQSYSDDAERWWAVIFSQFIDPANGSWRHELGAGGKPTSTIWDGRPDLYHSVNACLLSLAPSARTPIEVAFTSLQHTLETPDR